VNEERLMFGRGQRRGQATVVAREVDTDMHRYGVNAEVASDRYHDGYTYVADVQPDDGEAPFRATFRERFSHTDEFHEPAVGEQLAVTIDKKGAVQFDRSVLREMASKTTSDQRSRLDAIASAPAGTPVDIAAPEPSDAQRAEFRASRIRPALQRARAAGDAAEITRLEEMLAAAEAEAQG
jgi:hypothetical protein